MRTLIPKKPKEPKMTRRAKLLLAMYENGEVLQIDNNVENSKKISQVNIIK